MSPFVWVAVCSALAAWPDRSIGPDVPNARRGSPTRGEARRGVRHRTPRAQLPASAAVPGIAFGLLAVTTLGPARGLLAACVGVPAVLVLASRVIARIPARAGVDHLPFALDLAAAVLRGGAPVSVALEHAAPAAGGAATAHLLQTARLLRLGAGPAEAWRPLDAEPELTALSVVSRRSSVSGVRLAAAWEQLATDLRAERKASALARAHRAGVFAMAPLGLCFLPAFVCLGVVPDVMGIARDVLGSGG